MDMRLLGSYLAYHKQFTSVAIRVPRQTATLTRPLWTRAPGFLPFRSDRTTLFNPTDVLTVARLYNKLMVYDAFSCCTVLVSAGDGYRLIDRSSPSSRPRGAAASFGPERRVKRRHGITVGLKFRRGLASGPAESAAPRHATATSLATLLRSTVWQRDAGVTFRPSVQRPTTWEKKIHHQR
jgi:hypothetical protein